MYCTNKGIFHFFLPVLNFVIVIFYLFIYFTCFEFCHCFLFLQLMEISFFLILCKEFSTLEAMMAASWSLSPFILDNICITCPW